MKKLKDICLSLSDSVSDDWLYLRDYDFAGAYFFDAIEGRVRSKSLECVEGMIVLEPSSDAVGTHARGRRSLKIRPTFNRDRYESLESAPDYHRYFDDLLVEGLDIARRENLDVPIGGIMEALEEFRADGYRNHRVWRRLNVPELGAKARLELELDPFACTATLVVQKGKQEWRRVVHKTMQAYEIYSNRLHSLEVRDSTIAILNFSGEPTCSVQLDEIELGPSAPSDDADPQLAGELAALMTPGGDSVRLLEIKTSGEELVFRGFPDRTLARMIIQAPPEELSGDQSAALKGLGFVGPGYVADRLSRWVDIGSSDDRARAVSLVEQTLSVLGESTDYEVRSDSHDDEDLLLYPRIERTLAEDSLTYVVEEMLYVPVFFPTRKDGSPVVDDGRVVVLTDEIAVGLWMDEHGPSGRRMFLEELLSSFGPRALAVNPDGPYSAHIDADVVSNWA